MTYRPSSTLAHLLETLRQHPGFPELLKEIPEPQLPRFKISQAAEAEKARAQWIYESGRIANHEQWIGFLTGKYEETKS